MTVKQLKAAIYTRKSTEHGLDQDFNSLVAQREAAEAYITSQKSQGWVLVDKQYDDGGISGGTMERPALLSLLKDIEAGRVDIIVVYKVDRLTRSLSDFARIIDQLDEAGASFVSVTQQFNTSNSMGRLTLNVLLSFAQFEREVTAERIRDKVKASKMKGMWMGGSVPLGYDNIEKKLVINKTEAATVQFIFKTYLDRPSVKLACHHINNLGYRTKTRPGNKVGGKKFSCGHIYYILKNPLYVGEVAHKGKSYAGLHEPIIEIDTWQRVQDKLKKSKVKNANGTNFLNPSLLAGLIKNSEGHPLTPSHANKQGKRYRYYITKVNNLDVHEERYPAEQIENAVINELIHLLNDDLPTSPLRTNSFEGNREVIIDQLRKGTPPQHRMRLQNLIHSIILSENNMTLKIKPQKNEDEETDDKSFKISVPIKFKKGVRGKKLIIPSGKLLLQKPDQKLISLIAKAHLYAKDFQSGKYKTITELAAKHKINKSDFGKQIRLAYLAPDIIISILEGRQPPTLNATYLRKLKKLPASWAEQRELLHFT